MDWPDEERRSPDSEDTGRRRRITDVELPPTIREIEKALQAHELQAVEWRARHDERLADVEERAGTNRELLDGLLETMGRMAGTLESVEKMCLKIDGNTKPPSRWERVVTLAVTLAIAAMPVLAAYLALKGQLADVTQGPQTP